MTKNCINLPFGLYLMNAFAIGLIIFSSILHIIPEAQGTIPEIMRIFKVFALELFLVYSGFLIGGLLYEHYMRSDFNAKALKSFFKQIGGTILPYYYIILILIVLVIVNLKQGLPSGLWKYPLFLQNFSSGMPHFFEDSWVISVIVFAAIIGAVLLFLIKPRKKLKSQIFLNVVLSIILVSIGLKFIYNYNDDVQTIAHWTSHLRTVVIYRIDTVFYGVLAFYISKSKPKLWKNMRYIGVFMASFLFFGLNYIVPFKGVFIEVYPTFWNVWFLTIYPMVAVFMLPLMSQITSQSNSTFVRAITLLSAWSFIIFMVYNELVLRLLNYYLPVENLSKFDSVVYIVVYIAVVLASAIVLFEAINILLRLFKLSNVNKLKGVS